MFLKSQNRQNRPLQSLITQKCSQNSCSFRYINQRIKIQSLKNHILILFTLSYLNFPYLLILLFKSLILISSNTHFSYNPNSFLFVLLVVCFQNKLFKRSIDSKTIFSRFRAFNIMNANRGQINSRKIIL